MTTTVHTFLIGKKKPSQNTSRSPRPFPEGFPCSRERVHDRPGPLCLQSQAQPRWAMHMARGLGRTFHVRCWLQNLCWSLRPWHPAHATGMTSQAPQTPSQHPRRRSRPGPLSAPLSVLTVRDPPGVYLPGVAQWQLLRPMAAFAHVSVYPAHVLKPRLRASDTRYVGSGDAGGAGGHTSQPCRGHSPIAPRWGGEGHAAVAMALARALSSWGTLGGRQGQGPCATRTN